MIYSFREERNMAVNELNKKVMKMKSEVKLQNANCKMVICTKPMILYSFF